MSDEIIALRDESVAAQTMRFDLAKFKLVTTAVLGSIAIGAGTSANTEKLPYVIGLIPLVCIYIDLIADSKQIQLLVIGAFLKTQKTGVLAAYEKFCAELRKEKSIFIDSYAFFYSTAFLCIAIFLFGVGQWQFGGSADSVEIAIEIFSGSIGLVISYLLNRRTRARTTFLKH
jgi:hypothetical protein